MSLLKKLAFTFLGLTLIFLASCDKNRVYEENRQISSSWNKDTLARFEVPVSDSLTANNVYVTIRNTSEYPYSNLYLFVTTVAPSGAYTKDTIECILADQSGKWLGKGFAKYWDHRFPMRKNVRFPEKGNYTFTIQQGMRVDDLPGIHDVGIRIERNH